ncbi:MAG: hypothetical protein C0614_03900 [Desulfuromonas sp.]|nr:MAG: hypothetical protein C0614_03900 [Desulfuromonas sp.]
MKAFKKQFKKQAAGTNIERSCLAASSGAEVSWCLAGILKRIDDGVIVIDVGQKGISFCNRAATEILATIGLVVDFGIISRFLDAKDITLPSQQEERATHAVLHDNRIIQFSLQLIDSGLVFLQVRDITERKRLESIAQTINTMDNLGFIFTGIRHEIGNPLNSIKMTNSVLLKNLDTFSKQDISRYIDRTATEVSRMEYMLKSLKNFSMFEKVDSCPHGLRDFMDTLLGLIEPDFERKKIHLECFLPHRETQVHIDPRALHQAVLNILTNAADALDDRPMATISISTRIDGRLAWIEIEDNGCGMSEEQIEMLFQPFHTNKPHGNGLGLVITKKLLTLMNASLDISSKVGIGTTAKVGLPLVHATEHKEEYPR